MSYKHFCNLGLDKLNIVFIFFAINLRKMYNKTAMSAKQMVISLILLESLENQHCFLENIKLLTIKKQFSRT